MKKGKKITTIGEYFSLLKPEQASYLEKLRQVIRNNAPEASEVISYGMPAFKFHGILVYYAAFTNHYSLFPKTKAIEVFRDRLKDYETTKGTIHFPYGNKPDEKLVGEIVLFNVKQNLEKLAAKKISKSVKSKKLNQ